MDGRSSAHDAHLIEMLKRLRDGKEGRSPQRGECDALGGCGGFAQVLHRFCTGFPQAQARLPRLPRWRQGRQRRRERSRVEAPRAPRLVPLCPKASRHPEKLFFPRLPPLTHLLPRLRLPTSKLLIPLASGGGSPFSPSPPTHREGGGLSPARGVDFRPFESYSRERVTWRAGETG